MSKSKNSYYEVDSRGELVLAKARIENEYTPIDDVVSSFFDIVSRPKNSREQVYVHRVNGKEHSTLFLRLVASGIEKDLVRKRVQLHYSKFSSLPDDIIAIYEFDSTFTFIRSTNAETLFEMPDNITNLFWLDVRHLQQAIEDRWFQPIYTIKNKKSRNKLTDLIISNSPARLYSGVEEKIAVHSDDEEFSFTDFNDVRKEEVEEEKTPSTEVGRAGEEIINSLFEKGDKKLECFNSIPGNLLWLNKNKEMYQPYDFMKGDVHIEVKSSEIDDSKVFMLSDREKNTLLSAPNMYTLIKVNGVDVEKKTFSNLKVYTGEEVLKLLMSNITTWKVEENE